MLIQRKGDSFSVKSNISEKSIRKKSSNTKHFLTFQNTNYNNIVLDIISKQFNSLLLWNKKYYLICIGFSLNKI